MKSLVRYEAVLTGLVVQWLGIQMNLFLSPHLFPLSHLLPFTLSLANVTLLSQGC